MLWSRASLHLMQGAVGEFKTGRIIVGNDVQDPLNMQSWYVMVLISYSQRFALEAARTECVRVCLSRSIFLGRAGHTGRTHPRCQ